jgi:PAS domain S-box-containing protein
MAALCLLVLTALPSGATAGVAALNADSRRVELREQLDVLRDSAGTLRYEDLVSDSVVFRPADAGDISHGYTRDAYWYRVTLHNTGPEGASSDWVIEVDFPPLDHVDFYLDRDGDVTHVRTGDQEPVADGQLPAPSYAVPVRVAPGERVQLSLRVQTSTSHQVPLTLWARDDFLASVARQGLGYGVFFGVMLVMALYNLAIMLFVRDRAYLYYVANILSFAGLQAAMSGHLYQYLQPHLDGAYAVHNRWVVVFSAATLISILLFARSFLQTRVHTPRVHKLINGMLVLVTAFFAASFVLPHGIATGGLALLGAAGGVLFIGAGIAALRAGVRIARFYLAAWSVFMAGMLLKVLELFGILAPTLLTGHAWEFGSLVTVTLLSLALADRINLERKDKIAAEAEALAAREQAIANLARYQRIVESVPEGIFETDADNRLVGANAALAAMFGYESVDELKNAGRDLASDHVPDRGIADALFQRLRTEGQVTGHELQLLRRDRSRFWAAVSMRQIVDEAGRPAGAQGIVQDISERRERDQLRQARAAAEAATSAKSDFLAKMSHELRTPMNAIIGFSDLALRSDSDARRVEHLGHIRSASRTLLHIINDILDLSKIEAGKLVLERREFDLQAVLDQVIALLGQEAAAKGLPLVVNCASPAPRKLVGDPLRLEQVLVNLVGNAVKFTERGEVEVSVDLASSTDRRARLRFMVRDTGIGLSEEEQSRLFTPFAQADPFSTRRHGGTGLGLAISRQLVEKMGGRIAVESKPGVGSVFLFTAEFGIGTTRELLAVPAAVPAAAPAPPTTRIAVLRGARVLLVEDNAMNRQLAQEILQPTGVLLDTAENGPAAIAAVRQAAYNAVLMDVQMPGMDGYETTRRIRATPVGATLPIIALTANAMERDRQDCLAAGMNDFLTKPVDADQLLLTLSHWVGGAVAPLATPSVRPGDTGTLPLATPPPTLPPLLPGIDLATAVKRLGGRENLVLDVLHGILREHGSAPRELQQALRQGRIEDARIAAHTLKGLAATAGCTRLSTAARDIEAALKSGGQALEPLLDEVSAALEEVRTSASKLPASTRPRARRSSAIDIPAEMARLTRLLRASDSAAEEQVELLLPALRGRFPQEVLDRLARAVHSFDFDVALETLQTLTPAPAASNARISS